MLQHDFVFASENCFVVILRSCGCGRHQKSLGRFE